MRVTVTTEAVIIRCDDTTYSEATLRTWLDLARVTLQGAEHADLASDTEVQEDEGALTVGFGL